MPVHPEDVGIHSVRKIAPAHSERIVSAQETLTQATRVAAAKGVTRVADITGLDRIGIPIHSAVVPTSADGISISNGKGVTAADSRAGALMEAIERQTALHSKLPLVEGSYRSLREHKISVIDPESFNHKLREDYSEDQRYCWVEGYDLIHQRPVLVPAGLACYGPKYASEESPYENNSSNGLASGNCLEEAVCHALCELIERDAWTLAELRSQWIPWVRREALIGPEAAALGWDDPTVHPRIRFENRDDACCELMKKFDRAELRPVVRDLTSDFGIPCVMACVADDSILNFPQAHAGIGAHPNARIAALRALTELAQSRAVDIQSVREDLKEANAVDVTDRKLQRIQKIQIQRWMLQQAGPERALSEIASVENEDIMDDIRLILSRLTEHGIECVIVVDFSEPGPFSVVRVLVPGLEFWALDQGKVGERAVRFWNQHA